MKVKRALASLLSACMLVSAVPISAHADSKNFSGRSEMNWSESSRGWGYVTLQKGRILKAGEGDKLEDISSGKSVFNQFSFNRGQNFYDGFSKNTALVYDTTQGDYGAYLSKPITTRVRQTSRPVWQISDSIRISHPFSRR